MGSTKVAKLPFCYSLYHRQKESRRSLSRDTEHKHDMETEISAIDKHFHVCAAL